MTYRVAMDHVSVETRSRGELLNQGVHVMARQSTEQIRSAALFREVEREVLGAAEATSRRGKRSRRTAEKTETAETTESDGGPARFTVLLPTNTGEAVLYNAVRIEELGRILRDHVVGGRPIRAMMGRKPPGFD